jgi:hypothetical protein
MKILVVYTIIFSVTVSVFSSCKSSGKKTEETPAIQTVTPVSKPVITIDSPAPVKALPTQNNTGVLTTASLAGTWNLTEKLSHQQLKSFLGGEIADAEYAEMSLTGTQTFFETGVYDSKGELAIFIKNNHSGEAIKMLFHCEEKGTWRIVEDVISGTVTGGNYLPADEVTRQAVAASPELLSVLTPEKGATTQLLVVSVKQNEIILKDKESGWQSILTR